MSADFLSGLLLFAILVAGVAYVVKALFWESISARLRNARTARRDSAPAPADAGANAHLVGARGRVLDDGSRNGQMRVRVGMESWRARAAGDATLAVGTEVVVTRIDGNVLEVDETVQAAEPAEP